MIQESHVDIIGVWIVIFGDVRRGIRKHLEDHARSVVRHTNKVFIDSRKTCETEEGGESAVGAELNSEFLPALAASILNGAVEELHDLRGESFAADGANRLCGVIGEVPLMVVG